MLKIIKNSTLVPTPIVDLKLDSEPRQGSTDPVTSEGVKNAIDGAVGDAAEALQEQIDEIAEKAGSGYIPKGEADVSTINALTGQENGWLYTLTDDGTLTDGSIAVVAGDTVAWDDANSVWYKAMDYAPAQYGTDQVKNLPTSITAFRTGDVIPVDGPSGTAKMSKDDLLAVTAQNAISNNLAKQISSFAVTAGVGYDNMSNVYNSAVAIPKGTVIEMTYTPSVEGLLAPCGFHGVTDEHVQVWFGNFVEDSKITLPYNLLRFGFNWNASQAKKTGTFNMNLVFHTSVSSKIDDIGKDVSELNVLNKVVLNDVLKNIESFSVAAGTAYSNTRNVYDSSTSMPKGTIIDMVYTPSVEGLLADNCGFYGVTDGGVSVWFGNFVARTRLVLPYNLLRFGFSWNASQAKKTGTFDLDVTFHTSINTKLNDVSEVVEGITSKEIFRNPVFTTYSIADPAVFDGGDGWFYCFQTSAISTNLTNRKMIRSTNLVDWEESDDPISDETRAVIAGMSDATNFYAPHIIKIGEFFNMYISLQNKAMIVLRSKFPNGFYEFVGDPYVLVGPDNTPVGNSYEDAFVVRDRDGQLWLFYGSHGNIVRRKLEPDGLHVADNEETHVAGIIGEVVVDNPGEGPTLYRKCGYWWLFYARGNWMNDTYCEYVGRCETLGGTFVNKNGQPLTEAVGELVLDKKGTPYRGAAHIGDIIVDRENHYFVNVSSYNPSLEIGSRSLCLTEIKWGEDGWPEYHELSFNPQKRPVF